MGRYSKAWGALAGSVAGFAATWLAGQLPGVDAASLQAELTTVLTIAFATAGAYLAPKNME